MRVIRFSLLLTLSLLSVVVAVQAQEIESFTVPAFAESDGEVEALVRLKEGTPDQVELEIVEFHYFHHPELAPEPDTWLHNRQMAHMKDVLEGRAQPYRPSLEDPKVVQILNMMPTRTLAMERGSDGAYRARWTAGHGRFYLRPVIDGKPAQLVESLRVHCNRPRLDVIQRLASLIDDSRHAALENQTPQALAHLAQARQAFEHGHGLRFMLTHHGWDAAPLEADFSSARRALESSDGSEASPILLSLLKKLRGAEKRFRELDL